MANISSAYGTLLLDGGWTQEDIDAFIPVLNCWEFYGEYGIQSYDRVPTVDDPKTSFDGCGRWSFSATLESLHDWTLDWIKNPGSDRHPLSQEQYEHLICLMEERNLSIIVDFHDQEEGVGFDMNETGAFSVDNGELVYARLPFVIKEGVLEVYQGSEENVVIPKHVVRIGDGAFEACEGLTSVTILEGVTEIGDCAFSSCTDLTNVTIPEGVTKIGKFAFADCTSLTSVTIPESVTKIGKSAFVDCECLTSVILPKNVGKIDQSVFEDCRPVLIAPHIPIVDFSAADKPGACVGFARLYQEKAELDEEIRAGYLKYIKGQRKKLYPLAVQHEELLRLMLAEKMLNRKDVDILLAECDNQNNETAKAAVQDYINTL